jgi:hypothetical protein
MKSESGFSGSKRRKKRLRDGPPNRINKGDCPPPRVCYIPALSERTRGAEMAHDNDYQPGSMDISAHKKSYAGFLTASKWTFGFVLLIMVFLALFRTHSG